MSISVEDAEEYTQALGQVVAGGWRQVALGKRLGVPQALGLAVHEWVETRLGGYVRMSIEERKEAVKELAAEGESKKGISEITGVARQTIRDWLGEGGNSTTPEDEPHASPQVGESEPDGDGKSTTMPAGQDQADAILADIDQQVAERAEALEPDPDDDGSEVHFTPEPTPSIQLNSGDEWYTPRWLFDALGIDKFAADVCAPLDRTHSAVPAEMHFTIEDDGLAKPWPDGIVWCNPPYSKPEPWARRIIHHPGGGLLLTHIPMNAGWCVDVWQACDGIRLFQAMEFVRPDGSLQRPGYWLQLAAFGQAAADALARLQPLGSAAANARRVASPMWRRA